MQLHTLAVLLAWLGAVRSRDTGKTAKSVPGISNSLVNLGKMDISFYINTKDKDLAAKAESAINPTGSSLFTKPEPLAEEQCLCSGFKGAKESVFNNPSEILSKILMSNDLFSYNKEPLTSTICCESHEHIQEDTVLLDFGPKQSQMSVNTIHSNSVPFILEKVLPNKQTLPTIPLNSKAIEIFFFPKTKDSAVFDFGKSKLKKKDALRKEIIQIVGDKELRNDFKNLKFRPTYTITSVKKDLNLQETKEKKTTEKEETPKINVTTNIIKPNAL